MHLWTLVFLMLPGVRCFRIELTENDDVLFSVTSSVMRESWLPGSTVVYVTDGTVPQQSLGRAIKEVEFDYQLGMFEVLSNEQKSNLTHWSPSAVVGSVKKIRKSSRYMVLLLVSSDGDFLSHFVKEATDNDALIWPTRLILITRLSLQRLQPLGKALSGINAMVVTRETSKEGRWGIYMYLPYSHRVVLVASWTLVAGLSYRANTHLFPDKFRRLTDGAHLGVIGQNFPPHVVVRKTRNNESRESRFSFTGPLLLVLEMLARNINFTYDLVQPPDGSWGFLFPNGTWNGMIGMLHRKEVDFGLGPFGITYLRAQVVDFTSPLVVDYGRILGRRGDTAVDPWSFALPLTYSVWASTFATLIIVLLLAKVLAKIHWNPEFQSPRISSSVYLRTFLQQDVEVSADSSWERMILAVWILAVFVLTECYSTNLISLLAVRYISEPYQTVRAMLDDPKVTMIWFANTAHQQYLAGVESGIFYELVQVGKRGRMKLITPAEYEETVTTYVSRGDYVMMNPDTIMRMFLTEDYMDKGSCKFYLSKEGFLPLTFCMVVQKYSPLLGPINEVGLIVTHCRSKEIRPHQWFAPSHPVIEMSKHVDFTSLFPQSPGIRAVIEGGFYNYWLDNAFANAKSCKNPPRKITVQEPLALANLWGMFAVLVCGYLMGVFVLCLEIITKRISSGNLGMS